MVKLLAWLRALGDVPVACLDPVEPGETITGQERDTAMARNLRRAIERYAGRPAVVIAGNYHTRLTLGLPDAPEYRPMAYEVHALPGAPVKMEEMLALRFRGAEGAAWTCYSATDCGVHAQKGADSVFATAAPATTYFLPEETLDEGHGATLFTRKWHPSLPFVPTL
jgi:hypothetical protein